MYSTAGPEPQYPLVTTAVYERAWAALAVSSTFGTRQDHITHQYGVNKISEVRDFPGSRSRFAEMFPQDPMHDLGEGVAAWFLLEFLHAYLHQQPDIKRRFLSDYGIFRAASRWFGLPPLDEFALERITRKQTLMLSGIYILTTIAPRARFDVFCVFCMQRHIPSLSALCCP